MWPASYCIYIYMLTIIHIFYNQNDIIFVVRCLRRFHEKNSVIIIWEKNNHKIISLVTFFFCRLLLLLIWYIDFNRCCEISIDLEDYERWIYKISSYITNNFRFIFINSKTKFIIYRVCYWIICVVIIFIIALCRFNPSVLYIEICVFKVLNKHYRMKCSMQYYNKNLNYRNIKKIYLKWKYKNCLKKYNV